jgi:CRP-like cAMP-binding protein
MPLRDESAPVRDDPPVTIRGVFKGARQTRSLAAGDVLFQVGDEGHEMFGVISGAIELRRGTQAVQRIGPNGTFGELAIIDAEPRALTAVALEASEIAVIDQRDFLYLVHETPTFALDVMRSMSHLIRELSARG